MNSKTRMWIAFASIVALCCIDYAWFSEGLGAIYMNDHRRKLAHMVILLAIIPVGYWGWYTHPFAWARKFWLWSYVVSISFILAVGALCYLSGFRHEALLKKIGDIRLFFCSPVPFFMLYVLCLISSRLPDTAKK